MTYLHLAQAKDLNSILKHGLIPSYIKLDSHWESFKKDGLNSRMCVYLWDSSTYNNSKFARDMIYTKLFIHPRNDMFEARYRFIKQYGDIGDDDQYINFKKLGRKLYGKDNKYFLLEVRGVNNILGEYLHYQEPSGEDINTICVMDDFYAHNNKKLYVSGDIIESKFIKVVEEINTRIYQEKKIGFSFKKSNK